MKNSLTSYAIAGALMGLALGQAAQAESSHISVSVSDMALFSTGDPVIGSTILTREDNSVRIDISTGGLLAHGAYSVWWVVFNNPEYCTNGTAPHRCGVLDLPGFGGDPAIDASLLWAGGAVAGSDGSFHLSATLNRKDPPGQVVMGSSDGLRDVFGADVHVALRSHGVAVAGSVAEQVASFNGGCPPAACTNVQVSIHEAD